MSDPVLKSEMIASLTLFGRPKQWRYAFDMLPSPAMSADATVTSAMVDKVFELAACSQLGADILDASESLKSWRTEGPWYQLLSLSCQRAGSRHKDFPLCFQLSRSVSNRSNKR